MKFRFETNLSEICKIDLLVVIQNGKDLATYELPKAIRGEFERFSADVVAKRCKKPRTLLISNDKERFRVYFSSLDFATGYPENERLKIIAAAACDDAANQGDARLAFVLPQDDQAAAVASCLAEGVALGTYSFQQYKSGKNPSTVSEVIFFTSNAARSNVKRAAEEAFALAESVNAARDLINLPGSDLPPEALAKHARKVAKRSGLSIRVLDRNELKKQGYNGLLTVGAGSKNPPCMIILRYSPPRAPKSKRICLLGKGLTFDTGGLNIKTGTLSEMWTMKSDMSGAAAVLHAIEAIARRKLPINVTSIIVAAENAVGSRATLPGDIFVSRSGKTVQVENTDAEGRLALTDGLYRAGEEKATHIIDVATLTGACLRALGTSISGIMGNDSQLVRQVIDAGTASGEDIWELPLYEEYRSMLKGSCIADINNMSWSSYGGAIAAGLFLSEFVPEGLKWAHLDIAGTAFYENTVNKNKWKYFEPGGTGVMVRTLTRLAEAL